MLMPAVFCCAVAIVLMWRAVRAVRRRRAQASMIVTTYPDIELGQRYGGWDADAYDEYSARNRPVAPRTGAYATRPPTRRRRSW